MTPAYKEALKNREKDKPLFKNSKKKEAKHLGYSLSSMILWIFSMLHTTIDFQLFVLVLIAVLLTFYLWSWKFTLFTLILSIGFHLTEDVLHFTFMGVLLLTILLTFLASIGSISQRKQHGNSSDEDYDVFVDTDECYGSGDSGGGDD